MGVARFFGGMTTLKRMVLAFVSIVPLAAPAQAQEKAIIAIPGQNLLFLSRYIAEDLHLWEKQGLSVQGSWRFWRPPIRRSLRRQRCGRSIHSATAFGWPSEFCPRRFRTWSAPASASAGRSGCWRCGRWVEGRAGRWGGW